MTASAPRVAIVTGASRGIGRLRARRSPEETAKVVTFLATTTATFTTGGSVVVDGGYLTH